jgi:uncharacterized protein (DUF1501 family)
MSVTRREFLQRSALSTTALGLPLTASAASKKEVNCIFLMLVGGPSQLDTWDPKPDAPSDIRGPFTAIRTRVPGTHVSELFPRMASQADQFSIMRSMHHTAAPIHETGLQLLQTGALTTTETEAPYWGALVAQKDARPLANVLLPESIGFMGVSIGHGQSSGSLRAEYSPQSVKLNIDADPSRGQFGRTNFGDDCLRAARLIERGSRFVTVNMFTTVYDTITWDCHAAGGSLSSTLNDYRPIGMTFDIAYTGLLNHLQERGLLESTLVVATGEFGRTPHLNRDGGRDHWAGVWSMLLAGAGIAGGQVIGSSDAQGAEPKDQPYTVADFATLMRGRLGI